MANAHLSEPKTRCEICYAEFREAINKSTGRGMEAKRSQESSSKPRITDNLANDV